MKKRLYLLPLVFSLLVVVCLTLAACGSPVTIGATQTSQLNIPIPNSQTAPYNLSLETRSAVVSFGPTDASVVEGNFLYNAPELKPVVQTEGNSTSITEPTIEGELPKETKTEWNFNLGRKVPLNLTFAAGNISGAYDLGGLSLKRLNYTQVGGDSRLYFSQPNQVDLENLTVETTSGKLLVAGLSEVQLQNATFVSKQGDLSLDFFNGNGKLDHPIEKVLVKGENSNLTLYTAPIPAEIILDAGDQSRVSAINWTFSGHTYRNAAWGLAGPGAFKLTIHVELNGGNLYLH